MPLSKGIIQLVRLSTSFFPLTSYNTPAHDANCAQSIQTVGIAHNTSLQSTSFNATAKAMSKNDMHNGILQRDWYLACKHEFRSQFNREIDMVLVAFVFNGVPQIMHQHSHADNKSICAFMLSNIFC